MDGTLTPTRESITATVISSLSKLSKHCRIGILSGSDFDYILQQCSLLFDFDGIDMNNIDILPCNGTKFYRWNGAKFKIDHDNDMIKMMGDNDIGISHYQKMIRKITEFQSEAVQGPLIGCTLTGTFLQYRGSMLNWCFVGRNSDFDIRAQFEDVDKKINVRKAYKIRLDIFLQEQSIAVTTALGGKTSIDIYPNGWDKTFALRYYPGWDVYFVGDACQEGGNDWHIYQALKDLDKNVDKSYKTTGPEETINIINDIIQRL